MGIMLKIRDATHCCSKDLKCLKNVKKETTFVYTFVHETVFENSWIQVNTWNMASLTIMGQILLKHKSNINKYYKIRVVVFDGQHRLYRFVIQFCLQFFALSNLSHGFHEVLINYIFPLCTDGKHTCKSKTNYMVIRTRK